MGFLRKQKHQVQGKLEGTAQHESVDDQLARVVDSYSRIGHDRYIPTLTHRGSQSISVYMDEGITHHYNYVAKNESTVYLFETGTEVTPKGSRQGMRQYTIMEDADGRTLVNVSEFMPRSELNGVSITIPKDGFVKQFSSDGGIVSSENADISWLNTAGLLNEEQQRDMDMVGYALQAVHSHLRPESSLNVIR